jgi:hypothetical protein
LISLAVGAVAAPALIAAPASAAGKDFFTVETQFWADPSPIVASGGSFADCTSVTDLGGSFEQTGPNQGFFFGDKQVNCATGTVTIHYVVDFYGRDGRKTSGHWFVTESTVPGISDGFGTLRGDAARCQIADGSDGCILDAFAGTTS